MQDRTFEVRVFLAKLGSTEAEQVKRVSEFLRILADELEDHGSFGTGVNPCSLDDVDGTMAEYRTAGA